MIIHKLLPQVSISFLQMLGVFIFSPSSLGDIVMDTMGQPGLQRRVTNSLFPQTEVEAWRPCLKVLRRTERPQSSDGRTKTCRGALETWWCPQRTSYSCEREISPPSEQSAPTLCTSFSKHPSGAARFGFLSLSLSNIFGHFHHVPGTDRCSSRPVCVSARACVCH